MYAYNSSTWEVEARGSMFLLCSKLKANKNYMRSCLCPHPAVKHSNNAIWMTHAEEWEREVFFCVKLLCFYRSRKHCTVKTFLLVTLNLRWLFEGVCAGLCGVMVCSEQGCSACLLLCHHDSMGEHHHKHSGSTVHLVLNWFWLLCVWKHFMVAITFLAPTFS